MTRKRQPKGQAIAQLNTLLAGYRSSYCWAAFSLFLSTALQFLVPLIGSATIDAALSGSETLSQPANNTLLATIVAIMGGAETVAKQLWRPALAMLFVAALAGIFNYYQKIAAAKASDGICKRAKDQLYDHIQRLENRYLDHTQTGDLVQRCTSDIETVRIFLSAHIVEIGRSVVLVLAVLPIMLSMHAGLTLASLSLIPIIIAYSYFYTKQVKHQFTEVDEAEGKLTAVVQENITGIRVVRAFGRHRFEIEKFEQPNSAYRDTSLKLIRTMSWFWSLSDLICLSQVGLALFAGSYLALQGAVSIGTVFAFLALLNMVLWPVRMIGRILTDFSKTTVSLGRIEEILEQPYESANDTNEILPSRPSAGSISFENVTFSHEGSSPVVNDISFQIAPGETFAILGPSGSGKSTLMHLLLRFYDSDSGRIALDGTNITALHRNYLRAQFGVVLQEPFLYSRTISSNIQFGAGAASRQEVEEAARNACIHDTIQNFKDGYDTEIGERGITLSGGQRQRVALSRALLADPPVLLLDDALSAVDNETEKSIIDALRKRRRKKTTIVIAHRLTTLSHADRIMVLENGRISQLGTHQDLLQEEGLYRRLWDIQTQLEENLAQEVST